MNKKYLFTAMSFLLCSGSFAAELNLSNDEILACKSISDSKQRLACFDKVDKKAEAPVSQKNDANDDSNPTGDVGKWVINKEQSPLDDSWNVYVYQNAEEPIRGQFGQPVMPTLFLTCKEGKTNLFLNWDSYLGLDETYMTHRVDSQKPVKKTWNISTDNKAVFYTGKTILFIQELMKSKSLYTTIVPYSESPVSARFDLTGLSEAIKPLRGACKW
ncbi:type VI secretion protein [Pectobacterium carotovorum]|uniref:type VI secretion system-associated protein TagO n=1 Tax=Pectobacterium carotovorum TaxID=554 RepID=UPI000E735E15|nr:type VI secretion system-associated protein TagO [Pectobacterium carotovorum]RJL44582.1 type VI secretion protein [Pectobacterium carotovorum]